jgi:tRNA A-37 threonylcarbamoyl transferase component Bud32
MSTPSDPFELVGTVIERKYRIDAVVGEGGFGVVYRGFHLSFRQPVAVKCLKIPRHFTPDAQVLFVDKFREEGQHLATLSSSHLSIVRVLDFDVGTSPRGVPMPYMVLEWLAGRSLEAMLEERRASGQPALGEQEALALLRPAVEALAVAHEMGVAHRDIKPANLFVVEQRGPSMKVLDFGIAKAMQDGETATQIRTHTSSGFSAFSAPHGAPEQFSPKKFGSTGPWTDVHGLGLVLVELVTGQPALEGEDFGELFVASTSEPRPTPRRRRASTSDGYEALCAKAIARLPKDRFPNARALLETMDALARVPSPLPEKATTAARTALVPALGTSANAAPVEARTPAAPMFAADTARATAVTSAGSETTRAPLAPRRTSRVALGVVAAAAVACAGAVALSWERLTDRFLDSPYADVPQQTPEELALRTPSEDMTLPVSTSTIRDSRHAVTTVVVARRKAFVGSDPLPVVEYPEGLGALAASGFPASVKRSGPNDLYVIPLANSLDHWRDVDRASRLEAGPLDDDSTPLAVLMDGAAPYRALIEVLFTAGQSNFGFYELGARAADGSLVWITSTPPRIGGGRVREDPSGKLNLSVWITKAGIALKSTGGAIAPGCNDVVHGSGAGVTLPNASDDYDLAGLAACARRLKGASVAFRSEEQVTLTANPAIEYRTIIAVMDALRADAAGALFPEVHFGVAR